MKTNHLIRVSSAALLALAVLLAASSPANAQQAQSTYNVQHNFWIWPGNPVIAGQGWWRDYEHAWASQPGFPPAASWSPAVQNPAYAPLGIDWQDWRGVVRNGWLPVGMNNTAFWVPPAYFNQRTVNAASGASWATASSSVSANAAWGVLWGSIRSWGTAVAAAPDARAYAFSSSGLTIRGLVWDWRAGRIRWMPAYRTTVSGAAFAWVPAPRARDPINVRLFDTYDTLVLEDTPLDIYATTTEGEDGEIAWEYGRLRSVGVMNGEFHAIVESPYITSNGQQGRAELVIENEIVTGSYDTGIFEGLLPDVGTSGTFDVAFLEYIEFEYEYPAFGESMEIALDHAPNPTAGAGTGDMDGDGDVDLTDYPPWAACLAGPNVSTPPGGCTDAQFALADMDGDLDVDLRDFHVWKDLFGR